MIGPIKLAGEVIRELFQGGARPCHDRQRMDHVSMGDESLIGTHMLLNTHLILNRAGSRA